MEESVQEKALLLFIAAQYLREGKTSFSFSVICGILFVR